MVAIVEIQGIENLEDLERNTHSEKQVQWHEMIHD